MRFRDEVEHEPCPHCGHNACSWHLPGRICHYAYVDQPGEVRPRPYVVTLAQGRVVLAGKVA
jgi:hypothetical protein